MSRELAQLLQLEGIADLDVLTAIAAVPRHEFVRPIDQSLAYIDEALPIDYAQTISQPYVVARMTELLWRQKIPTWRRVLEIGTGSGYQAAILAQLFAEVYTIERIKPLYEQALERFIRLGYHHISVHYGDGRLGWLEHAPYDGILVTAGTSSIPEALLEQLAEGGCLILPLLSGNYHQLCLLTKKNQQLTKQYFDPVLFVPLQKGIE